MSKMYKGRRGLALAMMVAGLLLPALVGAQVLRVASPAPENSDYGRILNRINAEWIRISGGKVRMQVIHNGAAGGEDEMQRRIKQGTIQGGLFTSIGLGRINSLVLSMSTPLLIQDDDEMKHVFRSITPDLDAGFKAQGFVAIGYARGGWVYFYSRSSTWMPDEVRRRKIAVSDQDKSMFSTFESLGYRPVSVPFTDYLNGLNSGLVDTIIVSPLTALQFQWFEKANQMLDLKVAPFIGGILIDERAWNRVPENLRGPLVAAARDVVARELEPAVEKLEQDAIAQMVRNRLVLTKPTPALTQAWVAEFRTATDRLLGTGGFDRSSVEKIRAILQEYRAGRP
jgi:TRAP-type C4-dicarboxylate transport system substrate-binding protein